MTTTKTIGEWGMALGDIAGRTAETRSGMLMPITEVMCDDIDALIAEVKRLQSPS